MSKFFLKFILLILVIIFSAIIFFSYIGIETDKFNKLIKNKANDINRYIKLDFKKTKIHINLRELNIEVKLQKPKILIKNNQIFLSKINIFLPFKSFVTSDFLLKKTEVAFIGNDIKDLTKITSIFVPSIVNKKINKIFHKGSLEGELILPFESDGNIGKDYIFNGKISDASINLTKEFSINKLTAEITHSITDDKDKFEIKIKKGFVYKVELSDSTINLEYKNKNIKAETLLRTKGKLDFLQIKKISKFFNLKIKNLKNINGEIDLKTNIDFVLNKKFKVENLLYLTEGDIQYLELQTNKSKIINKYLPDFDNKIVLKDNKIKFANSKSNNTLELNGFLKTKDYFDSFKIKNIYDHNKKSFAVSGVLDLINAKVRVAELNYNKNYKKKSKLNFDLFFILDKYYNINKLNFLEGNNKIYLSKIKLNNKFKIKDFEKLEVKTFENKIKNNNFLVKKLDKIVISGDVFDAEPLLKSLYKNNSEKIFSNNFSSKIKINFDKTFTGTNDDVLDLAIIATIINGSFTKLSLKGNFSENEIVEMSIYQLDLNKKTLYLMSDRARPFMKNFDFIKGFKDGKLIYESISSKEVTNSNLIITDFKVSKVPALAQLLTLASLKGIADTLSGDGIRFESFEMKSNTKANVMNVEDALAIGPAISILLNGYVDKGKVVSLRGTLVPATKLNEIIASIPIVGNILVGKKTGEGVVGVSFKMKGPPKNIKTTVNPIKTLTPRFIVRAVEKMKKQKKEKSK